MRPSLSAGLILALSFALASCSESKLSFDMTDTASPPESGEADTGFEDAKASDTGVVAEPIWWRLSASLVLEQGVPIPEKGTLEVELLGSKDESLCVKPLAVQLIEDWPIENEAVLAAWKLTPEPMDLLCGLYETPLEESIVLGIGEMHADILAAIGAIPALDGEAPLNGAYMVELAKPEILYVYGVAGPDAAYAGEGKVASKLPLEDGTWQLEPVYRFSY